MTSELAALVIDAQDPRRLADFWAGVLDWTPGDGYELLPNDDTGFRLRFEPTEQSKAIPNQMHFDLTSESFEQQQETVARALELGAQHIDVGQLPEEGHVVLADPEGNEFCVIPAGNNFLADCGFVGALASDGTQEVGYFWSEALGWPLVWDQDEETAIRSPHGGPKVTWGGPPVAPKPGRNRLHFDLTATGDVGDEVDRLVSLGARRLDPGPDATGRIELADPDGNEFCLQGSQGA
jgi:predicted enzyme related to lactoylglutathione lyase